jgi:hypothetical protein
MGCSTGETGHSHAYEVIEEWLMWIALFLFLVHLLCGVWAFYMAMFAPIWTMGPEYDPGMMGTVVLK